jgi:subtilisin family serine protease
VAAGLTVTALFATFSIVPASAVPRPVPVPPSAKVKLPEGVAASRVVKDRYLVETVAMPLSRGGSSFANKASADATKSAAKTAGAKVTRTYSALWSGVAVSATEAQVRQLATSPSVKAIYPVLTVAMPKTTRSATEVSSALTQISAFGVTQDGTGIKVGVIDTGIDYDNADLGGTGTDATPGEGANPWTPTARVAHGYDFVGDAYDSNSNTPSVYTPSPDADPDDCYGHGTHVAGIIGADGASGGAHASTGVAPGVTFGAYRVFGCEGSTDTQVILDALDLALADGMNVVNLSLGSNFDSWPSYPDAVAVANLSKAGVVVVVSAGNSGDTGLFSAGTPAVGAGIISVASYEGETIRTKGIKVDGVTYPYTPVEATAAAPADNTSHLELRVANSDACDSSAALNAVPAGTVLLIPRAQCAFSEKIANAVTAGAEAVVLYNNVPGLDSFTAARDGEPDFTIPAVSIAGTAGLYLSALVGGTSKTLTWMDYQSGLDNPDGGTISTFSSAGLAADLSLVPTISAPGGKIYSTLPVEQGSHGNMSGTSMAAPFITGTVALILDAKPLLKGKPSAVAQALYSTAEPVLAATEPGVQSHPEGVFRQGSGLVNVFQAVGSVVTASPSVLKLGEGTSHTVTVTLSNATAGPLTYTASRVSGVSAAASTDASDPYVGTTTPLYGFGEVGFKAYSKSVTVKAGKTAKVKVKLTAPSVLKGKPGLLYGGWVKFTTTGAGNNVSVPFVGLRGDYQAVKLLNKFRFDDGVSPWTLPSLGYVDGSGYLTPETASGHVFTMENSDSAFDLPFVFYHLDYPASDVTMKLTNTRTKKSYDAILDWTTFGVGGAYKISKKSTHLYKQPRDAAFQYVYYGGIYSKGEAWSVPDGTYTLTLRVLKPLGTTGKKSHWESFTTKSFTIVDLNP